MASSDSEFIRKALIASFGSALGDDLLPEFVQLCKNYNKGPEDLFYTYESVIYGRQRPRIITQDILEEIKERLKRDLEKQNAKKQQQSNARNIKLPTRALKGGLMRSGGNSDVLGRLGTSASAPIKVKAEDGAFATTARPSSFAPSRVELRRLDIEPEGSKRKCEYY
ncbi:hypothetical protein K474DRAFT_1455179 [Panus rudis PR-1116 ss-1]|nr:hypothetical protein K474DRAFT_1455179 [Panus rudis PR-1116 ss-1]